MMPTSIQCLIIIVLSFVTSYTIPQTNTNYISCFRKKCKMCDKYFCWRMFHGNTHHWFSLLIKFGYKNTTAILQFHNSNIVLVFLHRQENYGGWRYNEVNLWFLLHVDSNKFESFITLLVLWVLSIVLNIWKPKKN